MSWKSYSQSGGGGSFLLVFLCVSLFDSAPIYDVRLHVRGEARVIIYFHGNQAR